MKPRRKETADALKSKSNNCINPYVMLETNGSKKLVDIINHMALKLFKEEAAKIVLRLDGTQYSYMKCLDHQLMVQDLFLITGTDTLEKVLAGHTFEETTLTLKYDILDEVPVEEPDQFVDDSLQLPDDIPESELMEMLTEVMSIMLFNKDEQIRKFTGPPGTAMQTTKTEFYG